MLSGPVELLFLLSLIAARTCSAAMSIRVGCRPGTFPSDISVCGVGPVRNSVDELFVEDTRNVSRGSTRVLSLNAMEPLSCCGGRLWASLCIVFQ